MRALFVCTANICRSPLAAGLFAKAAQNNGAIGAVSASAGFLDGGRPAHEHVVTVLEERGVDVSRKRSRRLSSQAVDGADVILTMTSEHARGVVSRHPETLPKVYTLKDFARVVAPRPSDVTTAEWLGELHQAHRRSYLGDDAALDIPDPIGEPIGVFRALAEELESLIEWIMVCAYDSAADPGQEPEPAAGSTAG